MTNTTGIEVTHKGKKKIILIDTEDSDKVRQYTWNIHSQQGSPDYAIAYCKSPSGGYTTIRMHRFILGLEKGVSIVDHRNHNGLDNRKRNLRLVTTYENARNCMVKKNSRVGLKGVCPSRSYKKYQALISPRRIKIHLGMYNTPEEAAAAYDYAAVKLFGEFAWVNGVKAPVRTQFIDSQIEKALSKKKPQ